MRFVDGYPIITMSHQIPASFTSLRILFRRLLDACSHAQFAAITGSLGRGESREDSDIDAVVFGCSNEEIEIATLIINLSDLKSRLRVKFWSINQLFYYRDPMFILFECVSMYFIAGNYSLFQIFREKIVDQIKKIRTSLLFDLYEHDSYVTGVEYRKESNVKSNLLLGGEHLKLFSYIVIIHLDINLFTSAPTISTILRKIIYNSQKVINSKLRITTLNNDYLISEEIDDIKNSNRILYFTLKEILLSNSHVQDVSDS